MDPHIEEKLKELQAYVPFLAELIKKLESLPSNSREAQLNKMKKLYGLLTGSAHKLKHDTLDKCESVLIRLQGKLTNAHNSTQTTEAKSDLEISLAKLKSINKVENPPPLPSSTPPLPSSTPPLPSTTPPLPSLTPPLPSTTPPLPSSSSTNWLHEMIQYPQIVSKESIIKPIESTIVDFKDHDYRPREELQGNLFQRRSYCATNDPISHKTECPKSNINIVEDVLKKPPLSADDITNLLHETTVCDEENLDSKDLNELYKLQNSIVDQMKNETDTGLNRLAFKYPRKKIDSPLSPVRNESVESHQLNIKLSVDPKPSSSIYANITRLSPIPQYNSDNNFMKQEWYPNQGQMNTSPIRNVSSMYGKDTNISSIQPPINSNNPHFSQKLQQPTSPPPIPQPLLNNSNNSFPWSNGNEGPQNQMSSQYIQQQQPQIQQHQFHQNIWNRSSPTMFKDQNQHQHFNVSYNNNLSNFGDSRSMSNRHFDDSYKKFHPKLNDMVERKFYEKSKKIQHNHNNIQINLNESTKIDITKPTARTVHSFEVQITATPTTKESMSTGKNSTSIGKKSTTGKESTTTGKDLITKGRESTSTGKEATSNGNKSMTKEKEATAIIKESISKGKESTSKGKEAMSKEKELTPKVKESTSKGKESTSKGNESTSKGKESTSKGKESTSKGKESTSKGNESTSKGKESTSKGKESTSKGKESTSKGKESMSISKDSTIKGKELTWDKKDSTTKQKEQPSKVKGLETEVRKSSSNKEKTVKSYKKEEISNKNDKKIEHIKVKDEVYPAKTMKSSNDEKKESAVTPIPENKAIDEEKNTKEWIEKTLINLFKPKSTEDSSSNILGLLSKVLDENKFNQIKTILQDDDTPSSGVEEATAQTNNKTNETNNSEKNISSAKSISATSSVAGGDDEKDFSEKDDISDTAEKPKKPHRLNELEKLNLDIRDMFISKGVLTSTGRRMCTILKDNAYTDTNEKEKRVEVENVRTTRRNAIKNLSVVVPKLKVSSNNQNVKKTQNTASRSKSLALSQKRRRTNRGKQWASGIHKRRSRRKQTKDVADKANIQTDDNNEGRVNTRNRRATTKADEENIETEVEDDTSDDQNSNSDSTESNSVIPAATVPKSLIKNIDRTYYFGSRKSNRCVLCSESFSMQHMSQHYVSEHNSNEVFISRLNPKVANIFLNNLEERSGIRTFRRLRPAIKFVCYFCDSLCFLSVEEWISHIASHTGEYLRKCTKCPWQTASNDLHQCTKKGARIATKKFKFEGNNFYGFLCTGCNYVQVQKENVKKHVAHEHDSSEKEMKILKINLINVSPVKIFTRGRRNLDPNESDELIELPETSRSPAVEKTKNPPKSKNSSKESVAAQLSDTEQIENNSLEKEPSVVPNVNDNRKQPVEDSTTQDKPANDTGDDDGDNKSNDSEWEDFDDGQSCDSSTSIAELQAEIDNISSKPSMLTNTLVRLLDKIKASSKKRKSSPALGQDGWKMKKHRKDIRDLLKQTTVPKTIENHTNETSVPEDTVEVIEIKEEDIDEIIKTQDQDENAVVFRIERMGYKIKSNSFVQAYTFLCLFDGCKFTTNNSIEFTNHIQAKTNEFWDGFCYLCESYVRADENMPLNLELKHMFQVHLKINSAINVDELVSKPPSLSLKKLPGDLLSSSLMPSMSPPAPTESIPEALLIKPWSTYQNQKTHANCREMLKETNLMNLYKCMGINCSYSTSGVINYLDHLKNHEKYAEDQLIVNPCNLDTSSWLECPYCEIFADTYYDLVQHVTEKHKNSFYQCGYCFYRSLMATNIVMHRNKHHNDLQLSILLCDKRENLPKMNFEKILLSRTNNIRPLHCNLESCKNKQFYALDLFLNHYTKHNQNRYLCEFCLTSVDSQTILAHLVTHGIGLFECIYCRFGTNRIKKLQNHMCDKHPTKYLFVTLRIFRHPENHKLPQHIASAISSIYLVNFGQPLTINFTHINSTVVNSKRIDLLENNRPKIFPSHFESACLLNIAECNRLIARSSVKFLEVNRPNSAAVTTAAATTAVVTTAVVTTVAVTTAAVTTTAVTTNVVTTTAAASEKLNFSPSKDAIIQAPRIPQAPQIRNIHIVTKDKTMVNVKAIPMGRLPLISTASLLRPVSVGTQMPRFSVVSNAGTSTSPAVMAVTPASVPAIRESRPITNSTVTITKIQPPKTFVAPKPFGITTQEKLSSPNVENTVSVIPIQNSTLVRKEISEERIEEVAKQISVNAISSKNTKFHCILPKCTVIQPTYYMLNLHLLEHVGIKACICYFCQKDNISAKDLVSHLSKVHTYRFFCYFCSFKSPLYTITVNHVSEIHGIKLVISKAITKSITNISYQVFVIAPRNISDEKLNQYKYELVEKYDQETRINKNFYDPSDVTKLPREEIFLNAIFCTACKYGTKVRKNMERHLMFHLNEVPAAKTGPINSDKQNNIASSSQEDCNRDKLNTPKYVPETQRFTCGVNNCRYISFDENMLIYHLTTLHYMETSFKCVHCTPIQHLDCPDNYVYHLRLHDSPLFKCSKCDYFDTQRQNLAKHFTEAHNSNFIPIVVIRKQESPDSMTGGLTSVITPNNSDNSISCVINNSSDITLTWMCNTCSFVGTTQKQVLDHNIEVHNYKSQYICKVCNEYRCNGRPSMEYHITHKHPGADVNQMFKICSRSDESELNVVDNSPLQRRDGNHLKSILEIAKDQKDAANSNSNIETTVSNQGNKNYELAEPAGMFCCNYCNYMSSYRGIKMHHDEKHRGREFIMKQTNLTTAITSLDKSGLNVVDNSPLQRRDGNRLISIIEIAEDQKVAANYDSNVEIKVSDEGNKNYELAVAEPAGVFCCNYCNYMSSYRGIKMHHDEKHRGREFIMKQTNLTTAITSLDKSGLNVVDNSPLQRRDGNRLISIIEIAEDQKVAANYDSNIEIKVSDEGNKNYELAVAEPAGVFCCNYCNYMSSYRGIKMHHDEKHRGREFIMKQTNLTTAITSLDKSGLNVVDNSPLQRRGENRLVNIIEIAEDQKVAANYDSNIEIKVSDEGNKNYELAVAEPAGMFCCNYCNYMATYRGIRMHHDEKHRGREFIMKQTNLTTPISSLDKSEVNVVDNSPLQRRDENRLKSIIEIAKDQKVAANYDSNIEIIVSDEGNKNYEFTLAEPAGMFCCNYCNYMATYRGIKTHHDEKHRDREFTMKRTNLTMAVTSLDKSKSNNDHAKDSLTMYLCGLCPLRHRSFMSILDHWRVKHQHPKVKSNNARTPPRPFQFRITRLVRCYHCNEKFGFHELSSHVPRRHPDLPIVSRHFVELNGCGECDYKCESNETDLVEHCKTQHPDTKSRTIPSDLLAESFLNRYIEMDVVQFYICTGCNLESDSGIELQQHVQQNHKDELSAHIKLKINQLMYACNYCKYSSPDEISVIKHIMILHLPLSSTKSYNYVRFKENIDKLNQMKIIFPNGLVLNKADVVKTRYGGYLNIIKTFPDWPQRPGPLSKKRPLEPDHDYAPTLRSGDIKRLKLTENDESSSSTTKEIESYDLAKIYTTMQIGETIVRVTCNKFAALFDINPVVKTHRI